MAKKAYQVRFCTAQNRNETNNATILELESGTAFEHRLPIEQLGIQALPGTKFYLNSSADPIIVGTTGIYELDLTNRSSISGLRFNASSLETIAASETPLLVDIVYLDEAEG